MATNKNKKKNEKKKAAKKAPAPKPLKTAKDLSVADGIPVHCACDDILAIDKIKPYPANANMHPEGQILILAKLIHGHGWRGPITISNQSGFVVRGHGRLQAARKLEAIEVPVDYQDYDSPEMERADRLADNRIQDLSEWDRTLLKEELHGLDSGVLKDMDLTGFDGPSLQDLMTAAPPPGSSYGDGESNKHGEGSNWNQSKDHGKEGRTRCVLGDLDIFIPPATYEELVEYLRDQREESGVDYPDIFEGILKRGMQ